jgi:predicted PurR-regulated permease PerM
VPPAGSANPQLVAILVALAIAGYVTALVIWPFLGVLAWAIVLTVLFYPVHRRLAQRLGRPALAALFSTLLVIVTILLPTAVVATATVNEVRAMAVGMPATLGGWLDPENAVTGPALRALETVVSLDRLREPGFMQKSVEEWGLGIAGGSLRLVGGALSMVLQLALIVFTMFFLFKDARLVRTTVYEFIPIDNQRIWRLLARMQEVVTASVYGTLLLSVIQGALGGIAFAVLGLPSPFLWGVVMTLASIIPMLGAFIVWGPAAIYLLSTGHAGQAAALTIWGTVVIGMADNVLRPILVGNQTRMHELLVFFGVLGGIEVFGVLGIVLGPVAFALTLALVEALKDVGTSASVPATTA